MTRLLAIAPLLIVMLALHDAASIWRYAASQDYRCPADTLLVMGAAQYDGRPSPAFQRRLDRAFELYQEGCAGQIVVSGGKQEGDRFSEGQSGIRYLEGLGVPAERLVSETEARTSYENLRNSVPLLEGGVLIITDDMHAYRSRWLAHHFGVSAEVAPVRTNGARLEYGLRELVILLAYQLGVRQ